MRGIIDTGGGLRGIFGAGVFDYCLLNEVEFDYGIGVSAGAANIASFVAKLYKENYTFYQEYCFRTDYISLKNFLKTGNYVNLDTIYSPSFYDGDDPNGLYRDFVQAPMSFKIVTTRAHDAETGYFDGTDIERDNFDVLKASSNMPVVNEAYEIDGVPYYDGGVSNPIPIHKAMEDGCDHIYLIITRPRDYKLREKIWNPFYLTIKPTYPAIFEALKQRGRRYNEQLELAKALEKEGHVTIIAPDDIGHLKTLTKDKTKLDQLYQEGLKKAEEVFA